MLTLKEIAAKIREFGEDKKARPFLCEGSPIGCEVFIIGHNPAVTTTFWDCWDDQYGCNRSKWIENYQKEVSAAGKRTRENTENLIGFIKPYRVLDTNICHKNAPKFDQKFKDECGTKVCDYLLEIIGPKLIFVHGKFAIEHLAELANLPKEVLIGVNLPR